MNTLISSLADDALSQAIGEAQATIRRVEPATEEVFERVRRFSQFYAALPEKPAGCALLYQAPGAAVGCRLLGESLTVGRLSKSQQNPHGCDLAFGDAEAMSRRHFEIRRADGFYVVRDLGSPNGTYVNGNTQRVEESVLKAGDIILAGGVIFAFTGD